MPGRGRRLGFRLDRVAFRPREPTPGLRRQIRLRTSPGADDLPRDEHRARPHARGPQLETAGGIGDQELAIDAVEKEVRVAAGQEPSRTASASQRIRTVPVGAAYRNRNGFSPSPCPASRSVIRRPARKACRRAATSSASPRPRASSGSLPSVKTARSRAGTTYVLNRGPQSCTSDASSQVDGPVPRTRAWMERKAARGTLSCRPAHAARRSERAPGGSRSSSAPTCRRNASICARVSSSRIVSLQYV
jgi:hypothetical protein